MFCQSKKMFDFLGNENDIYFGTEGVYPHNWVLIFVFQFFHMLVLAIDFLQGIEIYN
jgi:hypothetical protein